MNPDPNARDQLLNDLSSTLSPASEPMSDAPLAPPVIPDHELIRRIGRGSYGEVWLARTALGTWRAVKIVQRAAFDHDRPYEREFEGIRRFEPISRTHPSQLNVLHVGRNDAAGHFYYVMELADDAGGTSIGGTSSESPQSPSPELKSGPRVTRPSEAVAALQPSTYSPRTLRSDLYHRGRLPFGECLDIGLALATALDHLHRHGLVHRDIKPSNIVFVNSIPKLADIGLVAQAEATLSLVGTEGYLPPEGPGTAQADIYSLGKVLYEMATGRDRQEFPELPTNLIQQPATERAQLAELNEIIVRACHTDLKQRYQTAAELHAELALLQSGKSVSRMRTTERRLRFVARAGALVTALAVIAGLAFFYQQFQTREARRLAAENARLGEENRQRIVRLDVANGIRLLDDNDPSAALLWFADALPLVTNNPAVGEIHRIRIQQTLNQTPRLHGVFAEDHKIIASAFTPDSGRIATTTETDDNKLTVRDSKSGKVIWDLGHGFSDPLQIRFALDGQRLFVWSTENQRREKSRPIPPDLQLAEVLDAATGRLVFPQLASNLTCSAFSPDDRWLAVALTNQVIQLIDTRNGKTVANMKGHTNDITVLAFSADGSLLASGSRDLTARIWRVPTGEQVGASIIHKLPVCRVAFSADNRYLGTASWESWNYIKESQVQVWVRQTGNLVGTPITQKGPGRALFFSPRNNVLFTGGEGDGVRVWDVGDDVKLQRTLAFPIVRCQTFSPDGRMLALGTDAGFVSIWSTETWDLLFTTFRHTSWVESVHFSSDGSRLLTTSADGTAKDWSLLPAAKSTRSELSFEITPVSAEDALHRRRAPGPIPVALRDNAMRLIDPEKLTELKVLRAQETNTLFVTWSAAADGHYWAMTELFREGGTAKGTVALWSLEGSGMRRRPLAHPAPLIHVTFNPDSSRLLTFCRDLESPGLAHERRRA